MVRKIRPTLKHELLRFCPIVRPDPRECPSVRRICRWSTSATIPCLPLPARRLWRARPGTDSRAACAVACWAKDLGPRVGELRKSLENAKKGYKPKHVTLLFSYAFCGVADGARTHDNRNHNLGVSKCSLTERSSCTITYYFFWIKPPSEFNFQQRTSKMELRQYAPHWQYIYLNVQANMHSTKQISLYR